MNPLDYQCQADAWRSQGESRPGGRRTRCRPGGRRFLNQAVDVFTRTDRSPSTSSSGTGPSLIDAAVARANSRLPDYARVRRWALAAEPFTFTNGSLTANGRLRRGQILREHAQTLDWLYREPATAEEFCT